MPNAPAAAASSSQGTLVSLGIRAKADRDVTVIVAEATKRSEELRGQGDAERNRVLAEAYGRDASFFSFYRSMQAYEAGLRSGETRMVLSPDSDFFRYFNDPAGRGNAGNASGGGQAAGSAAPSRP